MADNENDLNQPLKENSAPEAEFHDTKDVVNLLTELLIKPYRESIKQALAGTDNSKCLKNIVEGIEEAEAVEMFEPITEAISKEDDAEGEEQPAYDQAHDDAEALIDFWYEAIDEALENSSSSIELGPYLFPAGHDEAWQIAQADLFSQLRVSEDELGKILLEFVSRLTLNKGFWSPETENFKIVRTGEKFEVQKEENDKNYLV